MAFKNENSASLEERLREEHKIKLISARNTSKIPTVEDILDTIVNFVDKYYLIADDYRTAFIEYEEIQRTAHLTASTTGGAQKHFVEASMLSSKHRNMFLRRYDNATRFNNVHDIYEILVAGGIINELDRTSSITELANRKPEDTSTGIVNAHYERIEVNEMLQLNEMMFKEMLEKEEDEVEELKKKIYKKQQKSEEESRETKKLLHEMRDAMQNLFKGQEAKEPIAPVEEMKVIKQSIEDIRKELRKQEILQATRDEKIDVMQESIYRLSSKTDTTNSRSRSSSNNVS